MKDVASVLFSNLHDAQERIKAIQSRLDQFTTAAPAQEMRIIIRPEGRQASVQPYFPRQLALALRSADASNGEKPGGVYDDIIADAARKNDLDADLLKSVVRAESGFRPDAVSRSGAQGLMQLMPATSAALGVSNPFDPAQNVEAGARYLKQQMDRFGNVELALAAYNAGPGNVIRHGGVPPFTETRSYVDRVMGYLDESRSSSE